MAGRIGFADIAFRLDSERKTPVKRVKEIVRIYAKVAREIPSILVMVGDGPDRTEHESRGQHRPQEAVRHAVNPLVGV